jgi:hypothetical protein
MMAWRTNTNEGSAGSLSKDDIDSITYSAEGTFDSIQGFRAKIQVPFV